MTAFHLPTVTVTVSHSVSVTGTLTVTLTVTVSVSLSKSKTVSDTNLQWHWQPTDSDTFLGNNVGQLVMACLKITLSLSFRYCDVKYRTWALYTLTQVTLRLSDTDITVIGLPFREIRAVPVVEFTTSYTSTFPAQTGGIFDFPWCRCQIEGITSMSAAVDVGRHLIASKANENGFRSNPRHQVWGRESLILLGDLSVVAEWQVFEEFLQWMKQHVSCLAADIYVHR